MEYRGALRLIQKKNGGHNEGNRGNPASSFVRKIL